MTKTAFHVLRIGTAITFLWIGFLIFQQPEAWGGYMSPWVVDLLPMSVEDTMRSTAILDIVIGFFLLINSFVWLAALVGTIHLIMVLVVSGITDITVRDIGILAGTIALMVETMPEKFIINLKSEKTNENI